MNQCVRDGLCDRLPPHQKCEHCFSVFPEGSDKCSVCGVPARWWSMKNNTAWCQEHSNSDKGG